MTDEPQYQTTDPIVGRASHNLPEGTMHKFRLTVDGLPMVRVELLPSKLFAADSTVLMPHPTMEQTFTVDYTAIGTGAATEIEIRAWYYEDNAPVPNDVLEIEDWLAPLERAASEYLEDEFPPSREEAL